MFNKEQLQRFSIRKLTVGTASVLIGVLFLTSWNANKVYADSGNVTNGESIAKNNNPQEGTPAVNDNAQIVDNGSTNGSTGISESPDSNRSNVIKSDNSRTTEPTGQANNKKVVSDANLTANDAQTKPTQQTAKSYAANSVVQRTKKLTGNAKLLADSKAQTDSNYSVTDNYPEGLMTHLPSDFDNKQEYAFEWLQNENNNIILTTNRTGDGVVYVYQDGKKVGTYLARNSSYPLPLYETAVDFWGNDYKIKIGEVYNDNFAGIVQSNGLNIIYSSHAKDVDDAYYSTVSFFVPHKIPQTVTYKDSNGNVIDSLTHTQDGLTGQSYTTGLPSGSKYVQKGEYLANITHNGNGLISEFHDGYTCTKDYHDGISVTFTENDSRTTGTGTMDYVIYDGDVAVQWGYLAYGQSTDYANDSGEYTIVNPYVPQTTNIVYQYKKLGNVVNTVPGPEGTTTTTTTQYTNDPNDPTTVEPINVPSIPGYTTMVNGKTVSDKTIMPADPGQDTKITYIANNDLNKTVTREVTITDPTGKKSTTTQTVTFTRGATVDEVTNKVTYDDWSENGKHTFDKVDVPTVPGYRASGEVPKVEVTPDTQSSTVNITYSANAGTQTIIYKEEDGSKVGQQVINGKTDEKVKVTPDVPDGYVVKGEIPTEVTIQADDTPITVTVEHGKSHIDPEHPVNSGDHIPGTKDKTYPTGLTHNDLNKTVTREVTITDPTGKKSTTTQTVTFTRGATVDEVTNKVTYDDWSENGKHTFDKVDVPTVPGYRASGEVPKVEVTPDTQSSTVNITYTANAQKAKITYIDDTTKTNLDSKDANGKFGQAITFETAPTNEITNYEKQGYVLVSNSFNNQMYDANDSNNVFYVHLKHDIVPVTPDNPGHPDAPINPNDPDGPKWPAGTDKDSLTKTGTQTIHYVGAGDKTPADNTQTYTFIKSMVIDKVTGKVLDPGSWNIDSYTFGTVKTPVIPGYHADKAVAGGETVTSDDLNKVITVTYAPDGNPGNPSDHGDTPSPEPTPEPNPTPDDQPDSETSSDEYVEKVKAEGKLDKTNPKKVAAYKKERKIIKTKIAKQGHTEIAEPIEDKVTRENNVKVVSDPVENKAAEPKLPQTGEADNSIIGLLGMLLASFAAMFGFDSLHSHDKKHKN